MHSPREEGTCRQRERCRFQKLAPRPARHTLLSIEKYVGFTKMYRPQSGESSGNSLNRWSQHNLAKLHMALFATLEINRSRQTLVTIKRTAGDARNFLVVDYGLAILHDGHGAADQSDIESLPLAGLARQLR